MSGTFGRGERFFALVPCVAQALVAVDGWKVGAVFGFVVDERRFAAERVLVVCSTALMQLFVGHSRCWRCVRRLAKTWVNW